MIKEEFLSKINKPARYIGKEFNAIYKDFDGCRVKFALCFPDLYEVGMSNLGIRIIYSLLNSIEDVVCERFFSPDKDLEKLLRQSHQELVSLESQKRLRDFDFIGFSLSYELEYPDVLNILDLGKIPLFSCQRDNRFPLVIAGGTCVLNPEPLWEFFDFFVFGEAEEVLLEIIDLYKEYQEDFKKGKLKKQELLIKFSQIRGIYVSSFYEVSYNKDGGIKKFRPKHKKVPSCIEKRTIKDLNKSHFPKNWIVPYISIIHDRPNIEIMRGCPNTCRFCQARVQYFPFRIRAPEVILDLAKEVYSSTGYEEIALCGLSVSDYPNFGALVKELFVFFQDYKVSISLPSLKPNAYLGEVSFLIAKVRKTTLTFAPEVGSERLRDFLGKDFNLEEFFKAISLAF
ncbi:MAG: TIGR03960 family B12-binding radical SAM protein, partial [Candidatus Omnitrophica bacterium]|nr:TIGR03960 family B12-binding radical SAM protein [Candidatus Omnitrophota bacterium]